jgi:moderate conductance mechanosensitive channel
MVETFKDLTSWLTTSGTKIVGILIGLLILSQIGEGLASEEPYQSAILEPPQILGVERFGESELVIRMTIKTAPLKQWEVGRELRKRIKARFDERGIQMPLPHRVLLWGETRKKGD